MNRITLVILFLLVFISCEKENAVEPDPGNTNQEFIAAVDISSYPEISATNPTFYDLEGNQKDLLVILKENGVNTVRLRLWVNPENDHSGFDEVAQFSTTLKSNGLKVWLSLHYSDTWADPGQQEIPAQWQNLSFEDLKESVYTYTQEVVTEIKPDFVQIGNEINSGLLHPLGHLQNNRQQFLELIAAGALAVRDHSPQTKIILHFAGIEGADWFFNQVSTIDYDIMALSYYPIWHGKSLDALSTSMLNLSQTHDKPILIAETAYPFTLEWNDWTNNIVGLGEQLILPQYPASAEGQREFIHQIKSISQGLVNGLGFCYWGAELVAWKGNEATDASPWENQALFDFDNKALPVLLEFNDD